jgi:uncharacterized protein with von Willebrand factor type A (vWA) domain
MKMNTHIIILLDESGSMGASKEQVINSVNKFIVDQKSVKDDNAKVYFLKFSSSVTTLYSGISLDDLPLLTKENYQPSGFTALYDAIAEGVDQVEKKKAKEDRAICLIITDGEENNSRKTNLNDIRKLITKHEAITDWSFVYIGKNPDEWIAQSGTKSNNSLGYDTPDSINLSSHPILSLRKSQNSCSTNLFK